MNRQLRRGLGLALALWLPATALADPKDDARRHFVAGLEAARGGEYEAALERFLQAQAAYPHPATLYNIGRSYMDLEDLDNALAYFRLYRDAAPEKAEEVTPVIAVIEARIAQRDGPAVPSPVQEAASAGEGGGAVSEDELARLRAIAAELESLTAALARRPAAAPPAEPAQPGDAVSAPPPPPEDVELPEQGLIADAYQRVVVTASRYGQDPLDSPSTVTVLSEDDIRLSGATNLPDLLRQVVGVEVMSLASTGNEVSIRGFNRELSNKVLVLIDGRSTYIDFLGTSFWPTFPIAMEEIERIEVIRGPGSAVYGANAVTGVINIITRTPGEGQSLARVEAGSPGYLRSVGVVSGRTGHSAYRVSASTVREGRWTKDYTLPADSAMVSPRDQDQARQSVQLNGRVDRPFGDQGFASLSAGLTRGSFEFYSLGALGDFFLDDDHHYVRGDLAWGPVHLRTFWNRDVLATGRWGEPFGAKHPFDADGIADTVDVEVEANGAFETGAVGHRINGGVGYRFKNLAGLEYMAGFDPQEHHFSAFVNEEASLQALKLVGSLRVDRHPLIPIAQTISPRGSAILRVADDTAVRVTGGSSFRAPNMLESYMDVSLGTSADGVYVKDVGNRELLPERIVTVEGGVHDASTVYHQADLAIYYNRLTNLIALSDVAPTLATYNPELDGFEAGTTGWENTGLIYDGVGAEAELELYPVDGLDLYANAAYTAIFETSSDGRVRDLSTSALKVNGGVMFRTPYRTDLTLSTSYVSAQTWRLRDFDAAGQVTIVEEPLDPRLLLNGRIGVRPFADESLELALSGWNLLAISEAMRFQEHPKGQLVGSRVVGTVTYAF